jgi:hypothetical protein
VGWVRSWLPSSVTGSRAGHPLTAIILRPWLNSWTNNESLVRAVELRSVAGLRALIRLLRQATHVSLRYV